MNLADAQALAELHMEAHGLTQQGWRFRFDRGTVRFGLCRIERKFTTAPGSFNGLLLVKTISLSKALTLANAEPEVEDTILHEVAHALAGLKEGHNRNWQMCASRIGARPEACYSPTRHGVKTVHKWEGICPACHQVKARGMRLPKRITSCGSCCRIFKPEFRLNWRRVQPPVSEAPATVV